MDTKSCNTLLMEEEYFGLDEALWLVENGAKPDASRHFHQTVGNGFGLDEDSMDFHSTFDGHPLSFDNDWMTTKIDFDGLGDLTDVIVGSLDQPESINAAKPEVTAPQIGTEMVYKTTALVPDTPDTPEMAYETTALVPETPDSPEQNVPNEELKLESSPQMNNFINAVCSGQITMNFPDLPCSHSTAAKGSAISENLELSREFLNSSSFRNITKSASFQNLKNYLMSEENMNNDDASLLDSNEDIVEVSPATSVEEVVEVSPKQKNKYKTKRKTPEQKQRKQLQNRNAATRYRCKKRKEQDLLNDKCEELEQKNKKLRLKVENLEQETLYLKNLIMDIYEKKT